MHFNCSESPDTRSTVPSQLVTTKIVASCKAVRVNSFDKALSIKLKLLNINIISMLFNIINLYLSLKFRSITLRFTRIIFSQITTSTLLCNSIPQGAVLSPVLLVLVKSLLWYKLILLNYIIQNVATEIHLQSLKQYNNINLINRGSSTIKHLLISI